jgi:hypothetical protein
MVEEHIETPVENPIIMDVITFREFIKHITGENLSKFYDEFSTQGDGENVKSNME